MESQPIPVVWLKSGELYVGTKPALIQTVLGSCVAVSLFDQRQKIGAICHSRLASQECQRVDCGVKICRNLADYVSCSLYYMLGFCDQHGSMRRELEVKLFGGANMFRMMSAGNAAEQGIGKRNVDTAMTIIRRERLHLLATDVGGTFSRVISFDTQTGEILLKRGKSITADEDNGP